MLVIISTALSIKNTHNQNFCRFYGQWKKQINVISV